MSAVEDRWSDCWLCALESTNQWSCAWIGICIIHDADPAVPFKLCFMIMMSGRNHKGRQKVVDVWRVSCWMIGNIFLWGHFKNRASNLFNILFRQVLSILSLIPLYYQFVLFFALSYHTVLNFHLLFHLFDAFLEFFDLG